MISATMLTLIERQLLDSQFDSTTIAPTSEPTTNPLVAPRLGSSIQFLNQFILCGLYTINIATPMAIEMINRTYDAIPLNTSDINNRTEKSHPPENAVSSEELYFPDFFTHDTYEE